MKGRRLALIGIEAAPNMWIIFDEPKGYKRDEQDETCKTYYYNDKLHAMTAFNKIAKAYQRSKKDTYTHPIKLKGN